MNGYDRVKNVRVLSFGYKYREVPKANMVFDVRFLQNPYYDENLRPFSGLDKNIQDYVLGQVDCQKFLRQLKSILKLGLNGYDKFGSSHETITIAFGCTGGKHRSVTLAIMTAKLVAKIWPKFSVSLEHLDLGKE